MFVTLILIILILIHLYNTHGAVVPDVTPPCLNGVCVEPNMCENNTVLMFGQGLLDIRISGDNDEPRYCATGERCCSVDNSQIDAELPQPSVEKEKPRHECGMRNYDPYAEDFEYEVTTSQFGEFPWMVAVLLKRPPEFEDSDEDIAPDEPSDITTLLARSHDWTTPTRENTQQASPPMQLYDFRCGGSLIHPSAVLTAAHCVDAIPHARLVIRAGEWDTQSIDEQWPHENHEVQHVLVHPHYYSRALHNDIALLFLTDSVRLASHINTVCLPPPLHEFPSANRCFVSGWGKNNIGRAGRFHSTLKRVEVPVVDRSTCQSALRHTRLGRHFRLHHSFICAGGESGSDSCKGDGGSPLVCPASAQPNGEEGIGVGSLEVDSILSTEEWRKLTDYAEDDGDVETQQPYYQAGIVSWGVGCNEQFPAVYVNVAAFRTWIDGEMALRGWDTGFYTPRFSRTG